MKGIVSRMLARTTAVMSGASLSAPAAPPPVST